MKKANNIRVRVGFSDLVMPKEVFNNEDYDKPPSYVVGYEDENGEECEEDGTYLNPQKED